MTEKHSWFDRTDAPHSLKECWKCGCQKGYSPFFKKIVYTKEGKLYEKLPSCLPKLNKQLINDRKKLVRPETTDRRSKNVGK